MRGFGWSDRPLTGYDLETQLVDLTAIADAADAERLAVVGHDLGGMLAANWAMAQPDRVDHVVLVEAGFAGLPTWKGAPTWHPVFLAVPDLPEALVDGREHAFVAHLLREYAIDPTHFSDDDVEAYAEPLRRPGGLRGALAHIRAMQGNMEAMKQAGRTLHQPVLAIGAQPSFGAGMADDVAKFAKDVRGAVAETSGHWVPEEQPQWLADQVLAFLDRKA